MITFTAEVGADNASWLASQDFLQGNAWDVTADGGTVRIDAGAHEHMRGLAEHEDGHVDAAGVLWISGDGYQVRVALRADEIAADLNAYEGENIWQDVILGVDGYDEALTDEVEHGSADIFALADGTLIRYDHPASNWYVSNETLTPVSESDIRQLRDEAGAAGDADQVALCDRALDGDAEAMAECRAVIREARLATA